MTELRSVTSLSDLLEQTNNVLREWNGSYGQVPSVIPWFRGEPRCDTPLLPRLYRKCRDVVTLEFELLTDFRLRAPSLEGVRTPDRDHTDQWMFLAQHHGLPTRLLDWTESLGVAAFFAIHAAEQGREPIVWMLNPSSLNQLNDVPPRRSGFPLTWHSPIDLPVTFRDIQSIPGLPGVCALSLLAQMKKHPNVGSMNINAAWTREGHEQTSFPVAIVPTQVHRRIVAQRGVFTVWGLKKEPLAEFPEVASASILRGFALPPKDSEDFRGIQRDLRMLGISQSVLMPDLDGLCQDLREQHGFK